MPERECFNLFHSQLCHGFGAPSFCPECGESWTVASRQYENEPCPDCGFTGPYDGHACDETFVKRMQERYGFLRHDDESAT